MNDQEVQKTNEVWGIEVPTSPGGRRKWPEAIKVKAVTRATTASLKLIALEAPSIVSCVGLMLDANLLKPLPRQTVNWQIGS